MTPGASGPILELDHVTVRYGGLTAVAELSLELREGEILALLGPNGAGKSSLLRAISGLLPLATGRIIFAGSDITRQPAHRRPALGIAHVPEGRLVFADQSVEDNLRLGAFHRYRGGERAEIETDLKAMLRRFPALADRRRLEAGSLSGGEQQQLAIGRALMGRPRLLMLDEPSLGLAPIVLDQLFALLAQLRGEGLTILLVEQLAERALHLAHRASVLVGGRLVLEGPVEGLRNDPRLSAAYLGS